jgi:transposase
LTDREWEIIEPLLPKRKRTKPPTWSKREILDGILYQLKNGCPLRGRQASQKEDWIRETALMPLR